MPSEEARSRGFYTTLGPEGLRRRTRPEWDAAITEAVVSYLGERERVLDAGCGCLWPGTATVEAATARWVSWFNTRRLYGPLGDIPPAEYEHKWAEGQLP